MCNLRLLRRVLINLMTSLLERFVGCVIKKVTYCKRVFIKRRHSCSDSQFKMSGTDDSFNQLNNSSDTKLALNNSVVFFNILRAQMNKRFSNTNILFNFYFLKYSFKYVWFVTLHCTMFKKFLTSSTSFEGLEMKKIQLSITRLKSFPALALGTV